MADAHKNFAYSLVATAPSPASSGTSLVVTAGQGTLFPAVPFNATIWPTASQPTAANAEIVRVTARSTDTLTITRTQEGFGPRTVVVGDQIAATITAKTLTDVETVNPGYAASSLQLLAWNYDLTISNSGAGMGAAGDMMMVQVPWPVTQTVTNVVLYLSAGGGTLTANQCLAGIHDSTGALLATTVNQATAWGTSGWKDCALTSPTSIPAGTGTNPCVYVSFFWNGSSQPSVMKSLVNPPQANGNSTAANKRYSRGDTGRTTTLTNPVTMSSRIDSTCSSFWAGLS